MDTRFKNINPYGVTLEDIIDFYLLNNEVGIDTDTYIEEWCELETIGQTSMSKFQSGEVDLEMMSEYRNELYNILNNSTNKKLIMQSMMGDLIDMVKRAENNSCATTRYLLHLKSEVLSKFVKQYGDI